MINDPIVYLSADRKAFKVGTKEQAQLEGWISMEEERKKHVDENAFVGFVSSLTMLNRE